MKNNDFMSTIRKDFFKKVQTCKKECENIEPKIAKINAEANNPRPLGIDEVAAAWVAATRVSNWQELGIDFGGYKTGRILAYILDVLNEKIEESTAATIRIDKPLYEQCPIVDSKYYGKTVKELMNDLAEKIEHSCDYLRNTEEKKKQILEKISTEQLNKSIELINEELKKRRINNVNKN